MSFSENESRKLDFAVFTNSDDDYCVISRSSGMPTHAEVVLDEVARACGTWMAKTGGTGIGIVPLEPEHGQGLAFRLFDVGEYRGRPHTVGIVGILAPPARERDWSLGEALLALPVPVPGSNRYPQPEAQRGFTGETLEDPYSDLDEWERRSPGVSECVFWSSPPGFCPVLPDFSIATKEGNSLRNWRRLILSSAVILVAAAVLAGLYYVKNLQPRNNTPTTSRVLQDVPGKDEIQSALSMIVPIDSWALSPAAAPDLLQHCAVTLSDSVKQRMETLRERLEDGLQENQEPEVMRGILQATIRKWRALDPGPMKSLSMQPAPTRIRKAVKTLERYKLVYAELNCLVRMDVGTSVFKESLADLLLDLSRDAAP
jgi:hypothetical protein